MDVLLSLLQKNSRQSLASICAKTGRTVASIYRHMNRLDNYVKYVSLIDFCKLGFFIRVHIAIKAQKKTALKQYLLDCRNLNNLYRLQGLDYYAELIFRDMASLYEFLESLDKFELMELHESYIIEDIATEMFYARRKINE